ncbi:glycine cleavage system aminomethyltransferase GcvT [Microbacterium radiodurans]|uniref:Aminomethyltransferase n=1 Tax=Microbacterium radiodurans TaxID=661398 RepID=A0A5J5ISP7_9MICO|nr:glycine cleavage system aminomethyltransferase GcvT [Microbacterium radiodurans]KAA9086653.1 glycine cleavage system protein T [Microbacterium radiodurans]
MSEPRSTVLHHRHADLGASFTDFGGWLMPVRYTSDLAEHHAVRAAAGLFDISHMAEFSVEYGDAAGFLDHALAGRISSMRVGKAKYSLVLAPDGGIVDDVIVYRTGPVAFLVIANAGNRAAVATALAAAVEPWRASRPAPGVDSADGSFAFVVGGEVPHITDITDQMALVAVQGPRALEVVQAVAEIEVTGVPLAELGYYAFTTAEFDGRSVVIATTGYTGEAGFELMIPVAAAEGLWDALLAAGAPFGLVPAGLASRDTLRLEAGMPLYGHELSRAVTPTQAGLARAVADDKADFVGKTALAERSDAGAPVLVGLAAEGRRAGRAGYAVIDADGHRVGEITSGALSPTLGHPIALAYVDPAASQPGTELAIDVRGTIIPATVTPLPFYRRKK